MPATIPSGGTFYTSNTSIFATFAGNAPAVTVDTLGTLTQNGAAVFQDSANIPNAFQIQNSAGTALLTADTSAMTITVQSLIVTVNLTVDGHIVSGGNAPTITPTAVVNCTGSAVALVTGTDTAGTISITTGAGPCSSGTMATVTFANPFTSDPHVVLTPGTPIASGLNIYVDDSTLTTSTLDIGTNATPNGSTTYKWNYLVIQ